MTLKEVFGFDKTSDLIAWFLSLSHFALSFFSQAILIYEFRIYASLVEQRDLMIIRMYFT